MKRYNLLIDCTFINDFNYWPFSIAIYACRLLSNLRDSEVFNVSAAVWRGKEEFVDNLSGYDVEKVVIEENCKITPWRNIDRLFGLNPILKEVDKRKIEFVLSPYHFGIYFFFPEKYHHHAIVQDMIPYYILEEQIGKLKFNIWRMFRRLLNRKIARFISISYNTRNDFKRLEGMDSVVVYNSIPIDFSTREVTVTGLEQKRYILDINRFDVHKNAEALIRAFALVSDEIPHILYLKGDERHPEHRQSLEELVAELGLNDRVVFDTKARSDGEIFYLYKHADLVVSPSLMEGFGWTPIEAAILEVPVIVSDIDVLKEITCGKIRTFNPKSPEELAALIMKTLANPMSVEERHKISQFFIDKYSLERQIQGLTNVLLESLN